MEDAHYSETDREDAAGVSTCDGAESLQANAVHRQQLLCFPSALSEQRRSVAAGSPPYFGVLRSNWRIKTKGKL